MTPRQRLFFDLAQAFVEWLAEGVTATPIVNLERISLNMATATYKVTIANASPGALHHATFTVDGVAQPIIDITDQQTFDFNQGAVVHLEVVDDVGGVLATTPAVVDVTVPIAPPGTLTPTVILDFVRFNP